METDKKYYYEIQYASGLLINYNNNVSIQSNKKLQVGQFIVVEHIGCGVFIGKVVEEYGETGIMSTSINEYRYLQDIDLSNWNEKIEKEKKIEELKFKLESKFAEIDKQKQFEYYAQIDDEFRELYLEYESLIGGKENENN